MKVTINEKGKTKEREFPKLMICVKESSKGLVVMFEKICSGQSLNQIGTYYTGYHSNHWDMNQFQGFEGSITLSND